MQLSKTQNSLVTVHHHLSAMNWQQPEFPAQVPTWPLSGDLPQVTQKDPLLISGHTKTQALWPEALPHGTTHKASPPSARPLPVCYSSPRGGGAQSLPPDRNPPGARSHFLHLLTVLRQARCSRASLAKPWACKALQSASVHRLCPLPTWLLRDLPGGRPRLNSGAQTERQGGRRGVTSSAPAGEPRAKWATSNRQPGPKIPEQGPLCPTTYSKHNPPVSLSRTARDGRPGR